MVVYEERGSAVVGPKQFMKKMHACVPIAVIVLVIIFQDFKHIKEIHFIWRVNHGLDT